MHVEILQQSLWLQSYKHIIMVSVSNHPQSQSWVVWGGLDYFIFPKINPMQYMCFTFSVVMLNMLSEWITMCHALFSQMWTVSQYGREKMSLLKAVHSKERKKYIDIGYRMPICATDIKAQLGASSGKATNTPICNLFCCISFCAFFILCYFIPLHSWS